VRDPRKQISTKRWLTKDPMHSRQAILLNSSFTAKNYRPSVAVQKFASEGAAE